MKNGRIRRLTALVLALTLCLCAAFASAERVMVEWSGFGQSLAAEAGLDANGLPGLRLRDGREVLTLNHRGMRMDSGSKSFGIPFDALAQAVLMEALGVEELPDFAPEDMEQIAILFAQLWQEVTARAVTVRRTAGNDSEETMLILQPKAFLSDLDAAVEKLLGENGPAVDALLMKYEDVLASAFGAGGLSSAAMLEGWKELGLSGLLPFEIPATARLSTETSGAWKLEISALGMGAKLDWTGDALTAELNLGLETYTFNTRDFEWLLERLSEVPELIPPTALRAEEELSDGVYRLNLRFYLGDLINSLAHGLAAVLNAHPVQAQAFLDRYGAWLELFGAGMGNTTLEELMRDLGAFDCYMHLNVPAWAYRMLGEYSFSLTRPRYSLLPLSLSACAWGNRFSLSLDETSVSAQLISDLGTEWNLSGWIDGRMGEAVLGCKRGSYVAGAYRLTLRPEGEDRRVTLVDDQGQILLTGLISGQSFTFEAAGGAYGSLNLSSDGAGFQLFDGYRLSSVSARWIGQELRISGDLFNQVFKVEIAPGRFAVSGPFELVLHKGRYGGFRAEVNIPDVWAAMLEVDYDKLFLTASLGRYGWLEVHRAGKTLSVKHETDYLHYTKLTVSGVDLAYGAVGSAQIAVDKRMMRNSEIYTGKLNIYETADELRFELLSSSHDPATLLFAISEEAFSSPEPEGCVWLSAREMRELLFGAPAQEETAAQP